MVRSRTWLLLRENSCHICRTLERAATRSLRLLGRREGAPPRTTDPAPIRRRVAAALSETRLRHAHNSIQRYSEISSSRMPCSTRTRDQAARRAHLGSGQPQVSLGSKEPKKAAVNLLPKSKLGAAAPPKSGAGGIFGGDFLTKAPPSHCSPATSDRRSGIVRCRKQPLMQRRQPALQWLESLLVLARVMCITQRIKDAG